MYEELLGLARKPHLWQRSSAPFWDDPHISKMMLASHLDPTVDAASRRPAVMERSVQWLATQVSPCGKILDLGCGPGLYTKRLSDMGYAVTGIDLSKRSIEYARQVDQKTTYLCQDYLTLGDMPAYDAVTLIYCDYAALTEAERKKLLAKVCRMLKPDGMFLFDVFTDAHYRKKHEHTHWHFCENGGFWSQKPHLCLEATYLFSNAFASADRYLIITKDAVKEHIIWDTAYSPERIRAELQASGFRVKAIFGDVCGAVYTEQSETLCCIATTGGDQT